MKDLNEGTGAGVSLQELLSAAAAGDAIGVRSRQGVVTENALKMFDEILAKFAGTPDELGAGTRKADLEAALGKLTEEQALLALGVAHRCRPQAIQQRIFAMRGAGFRTDGVREFTKAVKEASEKSQTAPTGASLRALTRDLDPELKLESPPGYMVDEAGVWTGDTSLTTYPMLISGVSRDIHTDQYRWTVAWKRDERWTSRTIARAAATDTRALHGALADLGAPVSAANGLDTVRYLTAFEVANAAALSPSAFTTRLGWCDSIYVAGIESEIDLDDPDELAEGWRPVGTWEGWLAGLEFIATDSAPWLVLYAAATGPLLRWMRLGHNPIVDLSGPRGKGKTTCLRLAGSGWGRPDEAHGGTMHTWDASPTNIERVAARCWDVPLLLDDSKRARKPQDVTSALYALAQGRGRGRGTPHGVQKTQSWRAPVISTGEAPLIEATEAGGARARVLSITTTPAISGLGAAKRLESAIAANYGHLGPRIAARAIELGPELRRRYLVALGVWSKATPTADTRLLSTAAALEVAHDLLAEIGLPEPEADWRAALKLALADAVTEADQSTRALDLVREDLSRYATSYRRKHDSSPPPGGWRGCDRPGDDFVGLFPATLRAILEARGHDLSPILHRWKDEGVIEANHGFMLEIGVPETWDSSRRLRVYAFRRTKLAGNKEKRKEDR